MAPRSLAVWAALALRRGEDGALWPRSSGVRLEVASDRLTLRELIERAVEVEGSEREAEEIAFTHAFLTLLGAPTGASDSVARDGPRRQRQFEQALEAFRSGAFGVLLDGHRLESLDDVITVTRDTEVFFVRLVPLLGG